MPEEFNTENKSHYYWGLAIILIGLFFAVLVGYMYFLMTKDYVYPPMMRSQKAGDFGTMMQEKPLTRSETIQQSDEITAELDAEINEVINADTEDSQIEDISETE